ncbi:MAG: glycosyltransferase family 2 protein [Bacteroidota bacterium]
MSELPLISVVIATFNRQELLVKAIDSVLASEDVDGIYELIVVDNCSTDETPGILANYTAQGVLLACSEDRPGASFARNLGIQRARGEYIAFIDDDAMAEPGWIRTAARLIREFSPDALGGPIFPYYLSPKPEWFRDEYEIRHHHTETGWYPGDTGSYLSGSNMIFRASVLKELGGFDTTIGPMGNKFGYGEDSDLMMRAHSAGKRIYYSYDLRVRHYVPPVKMTVSYIFSRYYEHGKALYRLDRQHHPGRLRNLSRESVYTEILGKQEWIFGQLKNKREPGTEHDLIRELIPAVRIMGYSAEYLDTVKKKRKSLGSFLLDLNLRRILFYFRYYLLRTGRK